MNNNKKSTTSTTVDRELLSQFIAKAKGYKLDTSKLLHRSMKLFLEEQEFRSKILNTKD